jgi:hypothetical protein
MFRCRGVPQPGSRFPFSSCFHRLSRHWRVFGGFLTRRDLVTLQYYISLPVSGVVQVRKREEEEEEEEGLC